MDLIESIIKKVLRESIERTENNNLEAQYAAKIENAIKKRYEVEFKYNDNTENAATGQRRVQIVAYGMSTSGNLIIRAFQPAGETKSGAPAWKTFRLDRIVSGSFRPMKNKNGSLRRFDEPPGPFMADGKYNPSGDKKMSQCFLCADFKGAEERRETSYVAQNAKYNKTMQQQDLRKRNLERMKNQTMDPIVAKNLQNYKMDPEMANYIKNGEGFKKRPNNPNNPAMDDMEKVASKQNFGLTDTSNTLKPLTKNSNTATIPAKTDVNLSQAKKNGPRLKTSIENQEEINKEEENNEQ